MKLALSVSSRATEQGGLLDGVMAANYHKEALKFTLSHLGTISEAKRIEAERQFLKVRFVPLPFSHASWMLLLLNAVQAIRKWKQNKNGRQ